MNIIRYIFILLFSAFMVGGMAMPASPVYASGEEESASSTSSTRLGDESDRIIDQNATVGAETRNSPSNPVNTNAAVDGTEPQNIISDIRIPEGFFASLTELINKGLRFVLVVAALLTFVYLIWGAIDWIVSGGDRGKTEQARSKLVNAVIGLIVVAASYALLNVSLNFLGYSSLEDLIASVGRF